MLIETNTHVPCRYLLTQHPEVEASLVQELDQAGLAATPACLEPPLMTAAHIPQLPYLQAVIKVCWPSGCAQLQLLRQLRQNSSWNYDMALA